MAPIEITVQRPDFDTVQVAVRGSLDLGCAYDFDEALRAVEPTAPGRLVLDLRGLDFLDTAGLARLVAVRRRCRAAGRQLVLVRGARAVQRLIALVAAEEQFDLVADPADVLDARASRPRPAARGWRRPATARLPA